MIIKINDKKAFWKTITSSYKSIKDQKVNVVQNEKVISEESELVEIFGNYFENFVENLNVERLNLPQLHTDPVLNIIKKFEQHPSIFKIKDNIKQTISFSFQSVSMEETI